MPLTGLTSLVVMGNPNAQGQALSGYDNSVGPSAFYAGTGLLDQSVGFQPGQADTTPVYEWANTGYYVTVDQVPSQLSTTNISAAAIPTTGVPLALVGSSGSGITVGTSVQNRVTGAIVTGLLAIDGAPGTVTFATTALGSQVVQAYDPTKAIARNVRINSIGVDTSATFTVRGFDIYGNPMTETITGASGAAASGKKAFKFVQSITPAGTLSGSNVSAGTGDIYGFPMRADSYFYQQIVWNAALIASTTGFTAAVTTAATATSGDVRGTYAVQSASDATKRLIVFQILPVANIGSVSGVTGVTQF